ncbi:hypothetical protein DCO46_20845 [Flavobacterium sp. HTF]|nr:hypothetical protein DCO46_20845 [Flavobacterium sp. HTF]
MEVIDLMLKNPIIIITLLIMIIFRIFPPKNINALYGYRSTSSMKNKTNWDFAQKYSANLFIAFLSTLLLIQVILYLVFGNKTFINLSIVISLLLTIGIVIYKTEKKLK